MMVHIGNHMVIRTESGNWKPVFNPLVCLDEYGSLESAKNAIEDLERKLHEEIKKI